MSTPPELERLQRWMQAVITHPGGVSAGVLGDEAQQHIRLELAELEDVVNRSRQLSAADRLAVYGDAYFARLLECLREEFPSLVAAIGEEAFDGLAFSYLLDCPSESYTLNDLGARFPQFLRASRPDDAEPGPNWSDFLIELAELERIYSEVFDGPGPERTRLLQQEDLKQVNPARWPQARLVVVPWLRLVRFQFPVHAYATAVRVRDEQPTPPAAEETYLAITRREYVVRRTPLSALQYALLSELAAGATIVEALAAAAESADDDRSLLGDNVRRWFFDWSAAGLFLRLDTRPDQGA